MTGGLDAETTGGQHVTQPGPNGPQYTTMEQGTGGVPGQSHLDSFFAGSAWTREDVSLLLDVSILLIMLYWAYAEVGN
ncbi:hypothetical protein [Halolamina sp. C58]|uniref:hypothetical protein n=1 Tax=Halolamina sp. C58 TaxID=3421640 RepID=UPI003EBBCABE